VTEPRADDLAEPLRRSVWSAWGALAASTGTLVCCALPALLVAIGAGAALAGLVSVFPQIVWLSEHKELVFSAALVVMAAAGWMQWRNRSAPCPTDPALRDACLRTRRLSARVFGVSLLFLALGAWFAFVQPLLSAVD
jgi:hypothetical protein